MSEVPQTLIGKAVGGDMDALSALLTEYGPPIAGRIASQINAAYRSSIDAEDVMQVTYLEAFVRIQTLADKGPEAFAAWLTQIATNNLLDAIRELERQKRPPANRRITPEGSESGAAALLDRIGWTSTTPSRRAMNEESQALLLATIDRLPPDYARVVRHFDLEGHTAQEVARDMNRSVGAVYMLRARALDHLRTLLSGLSGPIEDSP